MQITTKSILYWTCQITGWGLYVCLLIYFSTRYQTDDSTFPKVVLLQIIIGITALFSSHIIRKVIIKYEWLELGVNKLIPRILFSTALGAMAAIFIIHVMMIVALDWQNTVKPIVWTEIPMYTGNLFFILVMWVMLYIGYHSIEDARKSRFEKLETKAALKDAELIALKAQINPHFLFNSLNNIRALILEDQMKARDMVTNLSDLLRYSIEFNKQEKVTIAEEIEIVKNYLDLESIQYEDRLKFEIETAAPCLKMIIPPMVIQTMVENAIKHGISQVKEGGTIKIGISSVNEQLSIEVSNTGELNTGKSGTGIGIKNAMERIRLLSNSEPSYILTQKDNFVVATLTLAAKQ